LASFSPFVAGAEFTLADCAAAVHLPLIASACKRVLGEDLLASLPLKAYMERLDTRPTLVQVNADRKANAQLMATLMSQKR
jgi:glutathione S-transferase